MGVISGYVGWVAQPPSASPRAAVPASPTIARFMAILLPSVRTTYSRRPRFWRGRRGRGAERAVDPPEPDGEHGGPRDLEQHQGGPQPLIPEGRTQHRRRTQKDDE